MFENLDDPRKQMLLAAAAGLFQPVRGKGWSGFGEALGQGLNHGLLAYNQAARTQEATKRGEMDRKLEAARLAQLEQAQKAQEYMGQGIGKFLNPGAPSVPYNDALGSGPPQGPIPGQAPSFDQSGFASYLAQNPATAREALNFMPKAQAPIKMSKGDRLLDPNTYKQIVGAEQTPHWLDGGDKWIPVDNTGKQVGAPIPKNMSPGEAQRIGMEGQRLGMDRARLGMEAGRYAYEVGNGQELPKKVQDTIAADIGKKQAEAKLTAQQELPQVDAEAKQVIGLVDKLINHPGFKTSVGVKGLTGAVANINPQLAPGTDAADWMVLRDQIVGKQFMQAYQTLKGGGQITEVEGKKATEAIARMNTAQSEKSFIDAANEFKAVINAGLQRTKKKAGAPSGWSIQRVN